MDRYSDLCVILCALCGKKNRYRALIPNSSNAQDYRFKMKQRVTLDNEIELSTICRQLKMVAPDGFSRKRLFSFFLTTKNTMFNTMDTKKGNYSEFPNSSKRLNEGKKE